jgi:hypothetical protein
MDRHARDGTEKALGQSYCCHALKVRVEGSPLFSSIRLIYRQK